MASDDDVGSGPDQFGGQRLLQRVGAGIQLHAPVEEDDDGVVDLSGGLHGRHQVGHVVGRGQAGLGGGGRPGRLQVGVDDLGGGDDTDALAVNGDLVGREGLGHVLADPEDRVVRLGPGRQRHLQPGLATVLPVVVGLGGEVDTGGPEGGQGGGGGVEVVRLGLWIRAGPVGHRRLQIDHAEVHPSQEVGDPGAQGGGGIGGQSVAQGAPRREIDIAPEGQGHRLAVTLPLGIQSRVGHSGRGRGMRVERMARGWRDGGVAAADEEPRPRATRPASRARAMMRFLRTRRDTSSGRLGPRGGGRSGAGKRRRERGVR